MDYSTWKEAPFLRLVILLIAGMVCCCCFPEALPAIGIECLFGLSALALASVLMGYRRWNVHRRAFVVGLVVVPLVFFAGWALMARAGMLPERHFSNGRYEFILLQISNYPETTASGVRFEAEAKSALVQGKWKEVVGKLQVSLTGKRPSASLTFGTCVLVPAMYSRIPGPLNPGEVDFSAILARKGFWHRSFFDFSDILILRRQMDPGYREYVWLFRDKLIRKYQAYFPEAATASFLSALILGARSALDREVVDVYSKTGTMHVLSVSGMHVGIVFVVLVYLLRFMDRHPALRLVRALLVIALVWGYALLTGLSSAVMRAAAMLSFMVIGKATGRPINAYNTLAASAFLLLVYDPMFLLDAGFELSYLAVFGLIAFYPSINRWGAGRGKWMDQLWSGVAVSIAAQLATTPASIFYFHRFPVYFLLSNLFIMVPVALLMYGGILFLFIPFPGLLRAMAEGLSAIVSLMNRGLKLIEELPFSSVDHLWIGVWACLLSYLLVLTAWQTVCHRSRVFFYSMLASLTGLCLVVTLTKQARLSRSELIFYSLRNRTAIGCIGRGRGTVWTDLPEDDRRWDYSLLPFFYAAGVTNVTRTDAHVLHEKGTAWYRNLLVVNGRSIFVWDRTLGEGEHRYRIVVDVLVLRGNIRLPMEALYRQVKFDRVIFDSSNSDRTIDRWRAEALRLRLPFYVLKRNKAYVVEL